MAVVDYGALLRVNGKFINKNMDLFIDMKDSCGFILDSANRMHKGKSLTVPINGEYYVYAGTPEMLFCFYKTFFYIISNGDVIKSYSGNTFNREIFWVNGIEISVSHLDKEWRNAYYQKPDEDDLEFYNKHILHRWFKRTRRVTYKYKSHRFLVEWTFNGNKYEVIFGYGIDPDFNTWERIKNYAYDFSDIERQIIDSWFVEENT